ncbi:MULTISPECIES: hypothetical protein [Paraclostridium]|jgi:predicted metal-binding transcription factor (methanogenesis marker protein 9)|uniref:Uncharacterized protein n=2 Tax=Paraclostridium bifermentans TaxID=1490 RepID=A0A1X2JKF2_PARBF|nr:MULTISPECIES: hypothetical protein [Paraclostridium]KGJ49925.1 hypothetical protein KD33_08395 [Clostridium sp. NCR]MDV8115869.1 hypothetical protein [Bacillus sp. BAU-SS-2023]EQK42529.1 hypothetical protein C672_1472 [[Clostridium] bifermentans ATCC 638] [Paraclostridium bifermentans ATCC 638 = DSM 14991]MBN8046982.1 hypothetical protein [Paraclostridium bifermentans]MBS6508667.1 hypothetical protein [Paraclostridium bifermentans]
MGCPNCRCNKNKISEEEYNELREYLEEEIKDYKIVDYINEDNKADRFVEVEFEEYILELENIDTEDLTLEKIIENIIKNKMV